MYAAAYTTMNNLPLYSKLEMHSLYFLTINQVDPHPVDTLSVLIIEKADIMKTLSSKSSIHANKEGFFLFVFLTGNVRSDTQFDVFSA